MNNSLQWMSVLYGALIRLYPRKFKREFADEMSSVFVALVQDAASTGPVALIVFCLRELRDFPINLFRTHLEENPMSRIFDPESVRFTLRGVLAFVVLLTTYSLVFYVMMNNNHEMFFLRSAFYLDYYQIWALLLTWAIASAIAGTGFAVVLGQRPSIHWLVTLVIATSLPWTFPFVVSGLISLISPNSLTNLTPDSIWIKTAAVVLFALIFGILLVMLFKEQPRFRWFTLAAMGVWLPQVLTSDVFHIIPVVGLSDAEIQFERMLVNLVLGACLAGVFGMLLQNRRKLFLLTIAGGLLYVLVDYVFYQQLYFRFLPVLFPTINFVTLENLTNAQFAMISAAVAASVGLLFGLPLALIFVWLQKDRFPALPGKELQSSV